MSDGCFLGVCCLDAHTTPTPPAGSFLLSLPSGRRRGCGSLSEPPAAIPRSGMLSPCWLVFYRLWSVVSFPVTSSLRNHDSFLLVSSPVSRSTPQPRSLSSAPLLFAVPLFRRKPYIRLELLQEPIPRAGVAINDQPLMGYGRFRAYPCVDERVFAACRSPGAVRFGCGGR